MMANCGNKDGSGEYSIDTDKCTACPLGAIKLSR